jgi:hypothetical protein
LHKLSIQPESPDYKKKKKRNKKREKERKKEEKRREKEEKMVVGLQATAAAPWVWGKKDAEPCDPSRPMELMTGLPLRLWFLAFR